MTSHESSQNAESTRNVLNVGHTILIAPGTSLPHRSRNGGRGAGTAPLGDSTPSGAPSKQHGNGLASIPRWGAILKPFCSKLSKPCRGHTKGKKPLVDHGKNPIKTWYLLRLGMIHGMLITGMMIWDNLGS